MAELLLEIFSEEIPARMQGRAAADLQRLFTEKLAADGLMPESSRALSGPRRLTLVVNGLPAEQPDRVEEKKGPKVGAPDAAIQGFLRAAGLTSLDQCEVQDDKKGAFYVARRTVRGQPTANALAALVPAVMREFPWPKSMRWGSGDLRWVRPIHSLLCVFGRAVVPFEFEGLKSGNTTRGHRLHAPGPLVALGADEYETKLLGARVILDAEARRKIIHEKARERAKDIGGTLVEDPDLVNEVAGLVEWPVVLRGRIDEALTFPIQSGGLPHEVLTTAMRTHQKYFSVRDPRTGLLAPYFIVVANMEAKDGGEAIVAGNERVLRARLSDAKFFWDQDRKKKLERRIDALSSIVFHAKLGTVREKAARVVALAKELAPFCGADTEEAERAALLAKADLTTLMVGEFPELQGLMGRYYAQADEEPVAVAVAIEEHYKPLGPSDDCPSAPVSVAVALADKIDTLVGFFAIDEKPTGSKDPYALRRAALGIVRLILENRIGRLPLLAQFSRAAKLHGQADAGPKVANELLAFLADRLKVALKERGVRHDLIDAVFALGGEDDLVRLVNRVDALQAFLASDDGANLLAGYRRAVNILRIEEKKDNHVYEGRADPKLLKLDEEVELFKTIAEANDLVAAELERERFEDAMLVMARLRGPVDAFFDKVTVNAEDGRLRENRLLLLSQIRKTLHAVADFSKVEG